MKTIGILLLSTLLMVSCLGNSSSNTEQTVNETEIISESSVGVRSSPSLVVELSYNLNGIPYSALCVFQGHSGTCHVVSNIGDCWYDAFYSEYDNYVTYSISNPTMRNWVPGVCYFMPNGNFIEVQGFRYPLQARKVSQQEWQSVMTRYGFN